MTDQNQQSSVKSPLRIFIRIRITLLTLLALLATINCSDDVVEPTVMGDRSGAVKNI